jgi:hypothetical protein
VNSAKLALAEICLRQVRIVSRSFAAAPTYFSTVAPFGDLMFSTKIRKRNGGGQAGTTTTTTNHQKHKYYFWPSRDFCRISL